MTDISKPNEGQTLWSARPVGDASLVPGPVAPRAAAMEADGLPYNSVLARTGAKSNPKGALMIGGLALLSAVAIAAGLLLTPSGSGAPVPAAGGDTSGSADLSAAPSTTPASAATPAVTPAQAAAATSPTAPVVSSTPITAPRTATPRTTVQVAPVRSAPVRSAPTRQAPVRSVANPAPPADTAPPPVNVAPQPTPAAPPPVVMTPVTPPPATPDTPQPTPQA